MKKTRLQKVVRRLIPGPLNWYLQNCVRRRLRIQRHIRRIQGSSPGTAAVYEAALAGLARVSLLPSDEEILAYWRRRRPKRLVLTWHGTPIAELSEDQRLEIERWISGTC